MVARLKIFVLGAAAGGGLPQWNCGCRNCIDARLGRIPEASQSSLAVTADGANWAILNASPDIRLQFQACHALHPLSLRRTPIHSVLLTNGDIDHVAGLLSLREQTPFKLFATSNILEVLGQNKIFDAVSKEMVERTAITLETPFELAPGLFAQLFPVPGKVPLFMEGDNVQTNLIGEQTVGVKLSDGSKVVYYVPGCAELPEHLLERISDADALFFDGTVWHDDEMIQTGTGIKSGRRMGHIPISGPSGSIARLADFEAKKIYVHINNTNPIWQPDGPEREEAMRAGWTIGFDGLEVGV